MNKFTILFILTLCFKNVVSQTLSANDAEKFLQGLVMAKVPVTVGTAFDKLESLSEEYKVLVRPITISKQAFRNKKYKEVLYADVPKLLPDAIRGNYDFINVQITTDGFLFFKRREHRLFAVEDVLNKLK